MKDMLESLLTAVKERLSSPFIGSFIISWSVINWKFYIIFLFGSGVESRLVQLGTHILAGGYMNVLFMPSIAAIVYTLGAPLTKLGLDYYTHLLSILSTNCQKRLDKKIAYTSEEFQQIESAYLREVNSLQHRIKALDDEFSSYRRMNPSLDDFAPAHRDMAYQLLQALGEHPRSKDDIVRDYTADNPGLTNNDVHSILNRLSSKFFIQQTSGNTYSVTDTGRNKIYSLTYGGDSV